MDKEIIIVRESLVNKAFTLTYFGGKTKFVYNKDSEEVKEFTEHIAQYRVHVSDEETGEIVKFFYCINKGVAKYVIDFLVLKGEKPENIGIYDLRKAATMEIKCV